MRKIYLFVLFFLFFVSSWSQKVIVFLEVEPTVASPNEEITIKVTYNISGEVEINWPDQFNRAYGTMRGSNIMNDYTTGQFIQQNYETFSGSFSKAGTYTIGPAYVKKGNKIYKSNSVSVTVRNETNSNSSNQTDITSKQLNDDAFGIISISKNTVYEGEPVVVEAKIYSKFSPSLLESYKSFTITGISEKQNLQKSNNNITVKEEYLKNKAYYAFGYDKKVLFLSGAGEKQIDPFELTLHYGFQTKKVTSSNSKITVKALPDNAPASFTGGVGTFSIKRSGIAKNLKQGDVLPLVIEISGTGNLQQITKPILDLGENFTQYGDPTIKEDFVYSSLGAEGKITITYNLQVIGKGKVTLPEIQFAYFDPLKEKYIELKTGSEELTVEPNANFQLAKNSLSGKSENFNGGETGESSLSNGLFAYLISFPVTWVFAALSFILGLIWFVRKRKDQDSILNRDTNNSETIPDVITPSETENDNILNPMADDVEMLLANGDATNFYKALKHKIILSLRNKFGQSSDVSQSEILNHAKSNVPNETYLEITQIIEACEQGQFGMGLSNDQNNALLTDANRLIESLSV
jgi:hypothetical protein